MSDAAWILTGLYVMGAAGAFMPLVSHVKTLEPRYKVTPYLTAVALSLLWPAWLVCNAMERAIDD